MIFRSPDFDLSRDRTRIKDPRDAARQQCTVDVLLDRLFCRQKGQRFEIQVLADEVGMGKTFVALGVAYSVLAHLKQQSIEPDLEGCYRRVLILTPNNHALYSKWLHEVGEFVRRCVPPERQNFDIAFAPLGVDRLDDLAVALRKPGRQPQIIVARMGLFGGSKVLHYDLKRRFTLGVLFRYWGVGFNYELRQRLLKGAPSNWPSNPGELTLLTEAEDERLPFNEDEFLGILRSLPVADLNELTSLLERCREIAQPFYRNRVDDFAIVEQKLMGIYRLATHRSIKRDFPLLIVDEAHNWKNGPSAGSNGFQDFSSYIAPHVRRALLLTATPFQLRPDEMLEILKVSDFMQPCPTLAESLIRSERLSQFRECILRPVLNNSERHSHNFSTAWSKVPRQTDPQILEASWLSPPFVFARKELAALAELEGPVALQSTSVANIISAAIAGTDPNIRHFLQEALLLYACNADLSRELGKVVIRHRRQTDHRLFLVGAEYGNTAQSLLARPDHHILHAASGVDIRGEAELPQFVLMRCVSEMKGGKGRSSLASDLTGCYSTLHESAEGRQLKNALADSRVGRLYLSLLFGMVSKRNDPKHPKVELVANEVLKCWRTGEKVLIFCFRVNTAERLRDIIDTQIRQELARRRKKVLGGEAQLKTLRARLTGRERDLVVLGLDRILWSFVWSLRRAGSGIPIGPEAFILDDDELWDLARLSLTYGADVSGERVDRVFLNRATEHLLARRFLNGNGSREDWPRLVSCIAREAWISDPYGLQYRGDQDDESEELAAFDERGANTSYVAGDTEPDKNRITALAELLKSTRKRARVQKQTPLLDSYGLAPSLWLGADPQTEWALNDSAFWRTLASIHEHLWRLTYIDPADTTVEKEFGEEGFSWYSRALTLQALRRTLLRESVLLRLLPERGDLDESSWGELLARAFLADLPNQRESMAQRIAAFLEDLNAASGRISDPNTARGALYQATRLRDQQFVALVKGGGGNVATTRERVFNGFNTPLLPEVLVCTQVGQEGIDLHRQCRHVIHYDLAWNPAVVEQRTGRADRIGSKTFRERDAAGKSGAVYLEIGVPFLAGTYDERIYEELRLRAQTFEVLTGGDFAADHVGDDDADAPQGEQLGLVVLPLPKEMTDDLRVKLQIWDPPEEPRLTQATSTGST